jgi:uncharacterized membrane protein
MKKFFFLFLLYFFISVVVLLDRSGSLIASVEVGSCLSAAQVVVLYFYELFWKTYRKTIDKQLEK